MAEDAGMVRAVAWTELFAWLNLVRCLKLALRMRAMLLAAAGLLLTIGGWALLGAIFSGTADLQLQNWIPWYQSSPWRTTERPMLPPQRLEGVLQIQDSFFSPPNLGELPVSPYHAGWWQLSAPLREIFLLDAVPRGKAEAHLSWEGLAFMLLCGLWATLVWSFFGGALTRMAAVQLARGEPAGWRESLSYASSKWRSYFASPWLPMLGILLITIPTAIIGLLLRLDFGVLLVGIVWPVLLVGGLLMAIFLLGLFFGWPLMWGAISTEGTDSFDALSRSYSYVYQRPLQYLFYAVVAALLGVLGAMLAYWFADAVIHLTLWAVSWGSGGQRLGDVLRGGPSVLGGAGTFGVALIHFWIGCVRLMAVAFAYSYFWTASTAIYLLLRFQVDGTEMDEIYMDEKSESLDPPLLATEPTAGESITPPPE
jgi:hypothetical protein